MHLCKCNGVADLPKHAPLHMCYHAEFNGPSALKDVGKNAGEPQKMGSAETPLSIGVVADAKIYAPPHMCYHVRFGSSATKGVCINEKEPQNLRSAGTSPPWSGGAADHLKTNPLPTCVTASVLVVLSQMVYA